VLGDEVRRLGAIELVIRAHIGRCGDPGVIGIDDRDARIPHLLDRGVEVGGAFGRHDIGVEFPSDQRLRDRQLLGGVRLRIGGLDRDVNAEVLCGGLDAALDALPVLVAQAL